MIHSHKYLTEILYILGFFFLATFYKWFFRSSRPEVFCKKSVLGNFAKFAGKHLCQSLFLNKVAGLVFSCIRTDLLLKSPYSVGIQEDTRAATLLKKRLWRRRFPVNFLKFPRTLFYRTTLGDCFWFFHGCQSSINLMKTNRQYLFILAEKIILVSFNFNLTHKNVLNSFLTGAVII